MLSKHIRIMFIIGFLKTIFYNIIIYKDSDNMKTFIFLSLVLFHISLSFLLEKAGYNRLLCLFPGINLYYLSKAIKTNIILIILLVIGIILLPIRNLIMTLIYIYLPFIISYYYSQQIYVPIITLVVPFLGYPYMALRGYYNDRVR